MSEVSLEVVAPFSSPLGENNALEKSKATQRTRSDVDGSILNKTQPSGLSFDPDGK